MAVAGNKLGVKSKVMALGWLLNQTHGFGHGSCWERPLVTCGMIMKNRFIHISSMLAQNWSTGMFMIQYIKVDWYCQNSRTFPGLLSNLSNSRTFPGPWKNIFKFQDFSRIPGPVGTLTIEPADSWLFAVDR